MLRRRPQNIIYDPSLHCRIAVLWHSAPAPPTREDQTPFSVASITVYTYGEIDLVKLLTVDACSNNAKLAAIG